MYNRLSLTAKAILGLATFIFFLAVIAYFSYLSISHINGHFNFLQKDVLGAEVNLSAIERSLLVKTRAALDFSLGRKEEAEEEWAESQQDFNRGLLGLRQLERTSAEVGYFVAERDLTRLERINARLNEQKKQLVAAMPSGSPAAINQILAAIHLASEEGTISVQNLKSGISVLLDLAGKGVESDIARGKNSIVLTSLIALLLGLLAIFSLLNSVKASVVELTSQASAIRKGNFAARAAVKTKDELGELSASMNWMASQMGEFHRRQAEEIKTKTRELEQLKDQYQTVVEGSLVGIYVIQDGVFRYVNPALVKIFGYSKPKEIVGRPWQELATSEGIEAVKKSGFEERLAGRGAPTHYFFQARRKDGAAIEVEVLSNPGNFAGKPSVIGSLMDITERKKLEAEISESEERYRNLFETTPLCTKVLDRSGKVRLMNRAGREEHFVQDDRALAEWDWFRSIDPKYLPRVRAMVAQAFQGQAGQTEIRHTKEGSSREWCLTFFFPIKDAKGAVKSVLSYSLDITDIKASEAKVKELNELRTKFIQIVSHQLRTPLNAIRWNLEALLSDELGKLKREQKEFVRVTHNAGVEIIRRIHDLLTAMDIEEGRLAIKKEEVSLESLWGSVAGELRARCAVKDIIFDYRPPETSLPTITADGEKIREVLEKLADNAVSYTASKGKITATLRLTDGQIRFELADTGIGIPKAEQPRVFSRFFRASNAAAAKPDASGLGLSIVKFYLEQHGGKIGFESEEGKGSTFWFEIPI